MNAPVRAGATAFLAAVLFLPFYTLAAPVQCECIRWLRQVRGIDIKGNAWEIWPNTAPRNAEIGDVVLFDYGGVGKDHGAEITGFRGEMLLDGYVVPRYIDIIETNYKSCTPGIRTIEWTDIHIKGVFRPLR